MKPTGVTWFRSKPLVRGESGQDLLEYGFLMALIAVVAMGAVQFLGNQVNTVMWQYIASTF
jgi:Flp pilus assembly pilin Flp